MVSFCISQRRTQGESGQSSRRRELRRRGSTGGGSSRGSLLGPTGREPGYLVRDFLEGGLGGEPWGRTPPNSTGHPNVSCPSPPPRAVRGSAFYTEPQDPPSPGKSWKLPGPCGRARGQYWPGWGCHPLPRRGGFPPTGSWVAPYSRRQRGSGTPFGTGPAVTSGAAWVRLSLVAPPGFEPRPTWFLGPAP